MCGMVSDGGKQGIEAVVAIRQALKKQWTAEIDESGSLRMVARVILRLLPAQILLAFVGSADYLVSSLFASNFIGEKALSAVGLYTPIIKLVIAGSVLLVGGSQILCGKYLGANQKERLQNAFAVDILTALFFSGIVSLAILVLGVGDLSTPSVQDLTVRRYFNGYLIGNALGVVPLVLGAQFAAFLFMENKSRRAVMASVVRVVVLALANYVFVGVLSLGTFGLALASALSSWAYLAVMVQYFLYEGTYLSLHFANIQWGECLNIIRTGFPNALSSYCEALLVLIINGMILRTSQSHGISAYTAVQSALSPWWSVVAGMLAVSRLTLSISIGEEDRQELAMTMRIVLRYFLPILCVLVAFISTCAEPIAWLFYGASSSPAHSMAVSGLRVMPFYMPLYFITAYFINYGQAAGKKGLVYTLTLLDGLVCIAAYSALLMPPFRMSGLYTAFLLDGITTTLVVIAHGWITSGHFTRGAEDLMALPDDFGVTEDERIELSVHGIDEVRQISDMVMDFCLEKGIDHTRAFRAALAMEEMAGNVVEHGFTKDDREHLVNVRVVHKDDQLILVIKDDCVPFDPGERLSMVNSDDVTKNIGIRLLFSIANDIQYQNILGLNVLTVKV